MTATSAPPPPEGPASPGTTSREYMARVRAAFAWLQGLQGVAHGDAGVHAEVLVQWFEALRADYRRLEADLKATEQHLAAVTTPDTAAHHPNPR